MFIKVLYKLTAISLLISACSNESSFSPAATTTIPSDDNEFVLSGETVSGVSQKGPFIKGSTVTLYELDEKLNQTGIHYSTTIDNDDGKYHIDSVVLSKPYAWMIVKGNFIDEITGKKTTNPITLNGLVKVEKNKDININILSHLAFNRIQFLVQQGLSISQAQKQAEVEVLKAFNIDDDGTPFENMDIFANGEGDAKLLAITLILLNAYEGDIAKTTDLLAQITYDLETDGVWNDTNLIENLEYRTYESTGDAFISARKNMKSITTQSIPEFEKYINKFISLNHSGIVWGHCFNESELQRDSYEGKLHICLDSMWVEYTGFRSLNDPVVDTTGKFGTLVDTRDNHVYKTLTLKFDNGDSAVWMAENLQFKKSVYTRAEVNQDLCPDGWHISNDKEWEIMLQASKEYYQYGELLFNQGFEYSEYGYSGEKCYFMSELDHSSYRTNCDGHSQDYAKIRCIKDYIEPITDTSKYGTLTDKRDGRTYKTLDIELPDGTTATWMASLLEYKISKDEDSSLYNIPGVAQTYTYNQILNKPDVTDTTELYPLLIAAEKGDTIIQGICPENYHIPNHQDWDNLLSVTKENEQIKKILLHTQRSFNKTTNEYEFINKILKFNFDITGNLVRGIEQCMSYRPNHPGSCYTYTVPPYTYTDIDKAKTANTWPSLWPETPNEFVLRCVKD